MSTDKQLQEFKKDLAEVLAKHDARLDYMIEWGVNSIFAENGIGVSFNSSDGIIKLGDRRVVCSSDLTEN